MKKLFEPGKIGNLKIKNRTVMSPMQPMYGELDGSAGPRTIAYYEERARGGVGMIIVEATNVDSINNTPWDYQLCLDKDRYISSFQRLTEAVHKYDCKIFVQLHSYGAKSAMTPNGLPWGASEIPVAPGGVSAHKMTTDEIKIVEQRFVDAAVRASKAGFDGVELAGAHGYLLAQFLSPYYNNRDDEYGGCAENRCRIYTEIIQGIHAALGRGFPVSVRFPGDEFTPDIPGTLTVDDCQEIAKIFEAAGADVLNVSYGNNFNANANCEPYSYVSGWKKHVPKRVKEAVSIPVISTNTIKDPNFAEQMLEEEVSDFVALGRTLIADPFFVKKAKAGDVVGIRKCIGCMFCREQLYAKQPIKCALNPRVGFEFVYPKEFEQDGNGRSVAVIGGGPAGMEAAFVLANRGFKVTLFERENTLGGSMNLADKGEHKEKITRLTETMSEELRRLGVSLRLGEEPTVDSVKALEPAGVVMACGAEPIIPPIEGVEHDFVVTVHDVISGKKSVSGDVVIIGSGMTGLECAEKLCLDGCRVSLVEMQSSVGPGMFSIIVDDLMGRIAPCSPAVYTSCALTGISEAGAIVKDLKSNTIRELKADYVVLSLGVRPKAKLAEEFEAAFDNIICVGDNVKSGRIPHAMKDAYIKSLVFLKD